jgi:hypothetical protein
MDEMHGFFLCALFVSLDGHLGLFRRVSCRVVSYRVVSYRVGGCNAE